MEPRLAADPLNAPADPAQRKTSGERRFNWVVYGGIGWVANAILSVSLTDFFLNGRGKDWLAHKTTWLNERAPWFKHQPERKLAFTKKFLFVNLLCTGGTLLVPVMKWLEDRKHALVTRWDEAIYGDRVRTDPALLTAHQRMEHAPPQTWGSMLGARGIVIGFALLLEPLIGDHNSLFSRLLDKTKLGKIAGFDRLSATGARRFFGSFKPELLHPIEMAKSPLKLTELERRPVKVLGYTIYELVQSGTVAITFYNVSRVLARLLDRNPEARIHPRADYMPGNLQAEAFSPDRAKEQPATQVTKVTPVNRISPTNDTRLSRAS
jgi:hypothetical protein